MPVNRIILKLWKSETLYEYSESIDLNFTNSSSCIDSMLKSYVIDVSFVVHSNLCQ